MDSLIVGCLSLGKYIVNNVGTVLCVSSSAKIVLNKNTDIPEPVLDDAVNTLC